MRLTVTNVQKSDYGSYKCVAKNPRGEMDGTIKLYMSSPPTTLPPPTTSTLTTTIKVFSMNEYERIFKGGIGPTHSVIVIDKLGIKYQSNLNEIDKSEQKLLGEGAKGYDWSKDKQTSAANNLHLSRNNQQEYSCHYFAQILLSIILEQKFGRHFDLRWTCLILLLIQRFKT